MSSGGCKCGSNCSCGSGCSCEMYGQDVEKKIVTVQGVAPLNIYSEGSEKSFGGEGGKACKCGSSCTCDPCNC